MKKILIAVVLLFVTSPLIAGEKSMLKNGITLIEIPRTFTDTITVEVFSNGGLFRESKDDNGVGALSARVWLKSNKILEVSEFYGGFVGAKLSPYAFEFSLSSPTKSVEDIYSSFNDWLIKPKFDEKIFNQEKALTLDEMAAANDNPNYIASKRFNEVSNVGTPYELSTDGSIESVQKLTLANVEKYMKETLQGKNIVVAVAGNFDEKFIKKLKSTLEKLDAGKKIELKCETSSFEKDARIEDKDTRIKQAKLYVAYVAPAADSKLYPSLKLLNEILGGGMSSRYFEAIRKDSGYAYSVGSAYPTRACTSRFFAYAGLDTKNINDALKQFDDINLNLEKTLTDKEIEDGKKAFLGATLIETQTNKSVAWNAAFFESLGLGADYYNQYVETLKNINKKDLLEAAKIFQKNKVIYILKPTSN